MVAALLGQVRARPRSLRIWEYPRRGTGSSEMVEGVHAEGALGRR